MIQPRVSPKEFGETHREVIVLCQCNCALPGINAAINILYRYRASGFKSSSCCLHSLFLPAQSQVNTCNT